MTKTKTTKRALISSVLALFLCFTMLLGTTFAWFTDSVTSAGNIIQSGNLDVALYYADGTKDIPADDSTDWKDASKGAIYNSNVWEPGYTDAKHLKVSNEGSLALKYQLSIVPNGEATKLASVIDVYYIKDGSKVADRTALDAYKPMGTLADLINKGIAAGSLAEGEDYTATLVLKMQETAGNEYQELSIGADFAVRLMATQDTVEADSFDDQYDVNAPVLVWDGTVDTTWYNTSDNTYELSTPAALAGLAKLVNDGNAFAGKNIKMAADMDLNNLDWTAIGNGSENFNGNFYGEGYKIYNLKVSGTKGVGLFGFAGNAAHIEGVHIVGADVRGENSVGAVLGYGYLAANCLRNCVVEDAFVYAEAGTSLEDGDKVGAVAGWTSNGNIIGNKAINCEIYGCRDIGGIVGYVNGENRAVEVSGNYVENIIVNVITVDGYKKEQNNFNDTVGRTGSRVTVKDNAGTITKINDETLAVATDNESLKDALVGDAKTVVVAEGTYTFPASSIKAGQTLDCAEGVVFEGNSKLNINGATVVGATFSNPTGTAVDQTINGNFKDCIFTGKNGLRWCYAGANVVFENCVFDGSTYGVHFDGGANEATFKNCTFSGFNAMGGAITKLTLDGCTFKANGRSGYNGINLWGSTDLINCTFVFDGAASTEWVDACGDNKVYNFTNCVVTDGTTETPIEEFVGNYGSGNIITVDGVRLATDNDMFKAAVADGATKVLLREGEYDLNGNQKDGLTIVGLGNNVKMANTTKYASGKAIGAIWKAINLENVTITNTVYTMADGGNATFTDVNFAAGFRQGYGKNVEFTDCTFGSNSEGYALHFQTDSASEGGEIKLNGCKFEGGKVHLGGKRAYTFSGCDFVAGTDFQVWSNITLDGCTVDGVAVTAANAATLFPNLDMAKVTLK